MTTEDFARACELDDMGNHSQAFALFKASAESGDTSAMTRLAFMFGEGIGVEKDIDQSIHWDRQAIELGDRTALVNLGITYRSIGEPESAKRLFRQSLEAGDPEGGMELIRTILAQSSLAVELKEILETIQQNIEHATADTVLELEVINRWIGVKRSNKSRGPSPLIRPKR